MRQSIMENDYIESWIDEDGSVCISGITAVNATDGYYTLMSKDEAVMVCQAILAHLNQETAQ